MKMGVSMLPWSVWIVPARAAGLESVISSWNFIKLAKIRPRCHNRTFFGLFLLSMNAAAQVRIDVFERNYLQREQFQLGSRTFEHQVVNQVADAQIHLPLGVLVDQKVNDTATQKFQVVFQKVITDKPYLPFTGFLQQFGSHRCAF